MVSEKSQRFKKVYIEITNVCNLSCSFCPGTVRKSTFMSLCDFEKVLGRITGYTRYIYLHVMGEPLLHPELTKIFEISHSYGFRVNITTNGTLILKRQKDLLDAHALRQVNFSLHSREGVVSPEERKKYLDDIFRFSDKALERGDIFISYRLWNIGASSADKYNKWVLESIEKHCSIDFSLWNTFIEKDRITVKDRLYINRAEVFQWPDDCHAEDDPTDDTVSSACVKPDSCSREKPISKGFCMGLRDQLAILSDGTVVPCCLDNNGIISLGNIFSQELKHILKSKRAEAFYNGFSQRRVVEQLCRSCSYRERFS
jgi:radical SAM protein with 4Fe4S-binding SPASM domain